ncbi:unnamed protein product [Trichobilharzia regenti]|nr:unnamed protein product [Trichobilharzia regenti]
MTLEISDDFIQPVDLAAYPDYLFINAFPIDLTFILNRLLNGFYRQPESLKSDFIQLLENTERYNLPDSIIVQNAQLVCQLGLYCIENMVDSKMMVGGLYATSVYSKPALTLINTWTVGVDVISDYRPKAECTAHQSTSRRS